MNLFFGRKKKKRKKYIDSLLKNLQLMNGGLVKRRGHLLLVLKSLLQVDFYYINIQMLHTFLDICVREMKL